MEGEAQPQRMVTGDEQRMGERAPLLKQSSPAFSVQAEDSACASHHPIEPFALVNGGSLVPNTHASNAGVSEPQVQLAWQSRLCFCCSHRTLWRTCWTVSVST